LRWPVRGWLAPEYAALERVGAVSDADAARLEHLGVRRDAISVTGDTRYDSAADRVARIDPAAPHVIRARGRPGAFTIVAGSTWPPDEAVVLPAFAALRARVPTARLVLAPHEPTPEHFAGIASRAVPCGLGRPGRLSRVEPGGAEPFIVVDRVGVLADLYGVAAAAYVGGGYHGAGLHSVLEPAACSVPVTFGPRWRNSRDAELLLGAGGAAALPAHGGDRALLAQWLAWHADPAARARAGAAARDLVTAGRGAAERTAALVRELAESRR
jgi:3-deoxy-D-manno-octulosonic-acid transferase